MTGSATSNHFGSLILKVPPRIEIKVSLRTRDLLEVRTLVAAKAEGILRPLLVYVKQLAIAISPAIRPRVQLLKAPPRLLRRRIKFGSPASRATFEQVPVMQQAVEHGADRGCIPQQLPPILDRTIGSEQGTGTLISSH